MLRSQMDVKATQTFIGGTEKDPLDTEAFFKISSFVSDRFGTTRECVNDDRMIIFMRTNPLTLHS